MMSRLIARAQSTAREAQRRRLDTLSALLGEKGLSVEVGPDSIACSERGLMQRWLGDPALRFIARSGS